MSQPDKSKRAKPAGKKKSKKRSAELGAPPDLDAADTSKKGAKHKPTSRSDRKDKRKKGAATEEETRWERTRANMRTIGGAVLLALFIRIGLFEAFEIEGPSMEPTLLNGDRVVVAKFSYGLFLPLATEATWTWDAPDVGEVVIVKSPHDNIDIVKRVVAIGGDTVEIRDDIVYRNGAPVPTEELGTCEDDTGRAIPGCVWVEETLEGRTHRTSRDTSSPPSNHPPSVVPEGYVYILGDHRDRSNDSRYFGVVPVSRVKGRAMVIYWSHDGPSIFHSPGEWAATIRGDRLFDSVE
jgi:signal peptidase I